MKEGWGYKEHVLEEGWGYKEHVLKEGWGYKEHVSFVLFISRDG
jgi:hypothetical protein